MGRNETQKEKLATGMTLVGLSSRYFNVFFVFMSRICENISENDKLPHIS